MWPDISIRKVRGGTLAQDLDIKSITESDLEFATDKKPSEQEITDMLAAWRMVKIVKSNAIVVVKDGTMIGKGGGQTSRVEAMDIALSHAGDAAKGAVIASDAFFPFADGLLSAAEAGATAVIQPGGSMRDAEVIAAADEAGLAMVFTGMRHFRH